MLFIEKSAIHCITLFAESYGQNVFQCALYIQVRCICCVPCSPLSYFLSPVHSSISFQCIASLSMHCLAKTICKKKNSWCIESLEFSPEKDNGWGITYSVISALRYLR